MIHETTLYMTKDSILSLSANPLSMINYTLPALSYYIRHMHSFTCQNFRLSVIVRCLNFIMYILNLSHQSNQIRIGWDRSLHCSNFDNIGNNKQTIYTHRSLLPYLNDFLKWNVLIIMHLTLQVHKAKKIGGFIQL